MGSYVYQVTNTSKMIQSFQGYTLAPEKTITVRKLSPGVITAFKKNLILLIPSLLDIDVFKIVNVSTYVIPLDDLLLQPNDSAWVEGLNVEILTLWQNGSIAIDPNPFTVPVFDGVSPSPVGSPVGGGGIDTNLQQATNDDFVNMTFGSPVYSDANGLLVRRAVGNSQQSKQVWGLVADSSISPGNLVNIMVGGTLTGSLSQWNVATGMSGGLITNSIYYLSVDSPGKITPFGPTPIDGVDLWSVQIGTALSTTTMKIEVQQSVKL